LTKPSFAKAPAGRCRFARPEFQLLHPWKAGEGNRSLGISSLNSKYKSGATSPKAAKSARMVTRATVCIRVRREKGRAIPQQIFPRKIGTSGTNLLDEPPTVSEAAPKVFPEDEVSVGEELVYEGSDEADRERRPAAAIPISGRNRGANKTLGNALRLGNGLGAAHLLKGQASCA
jgi:hypothetical protein